MHVELSAGGWAEPDAGGGGSWELGDGGLSAAVRRQPTVVAEAGAVPSPERASLGSDEGAACRGAGGLGLAGTGMLGRCCGVGWLCEACAAARLAPTSYASIGEPE